MTICAAFWVHTNIRPDNRIFPCCRYKEPVATFDGDVGKILHSDVYNNLRSDSLNGIYQPGCEKCYYEERHGKESLRQRFNAEYSTDKVELKFLEIGFDNICNLACDGCWEEWSSTWANIKNHTSKKINVITTAEFKNLPETIDKVLFLGGEPLMTNRHSRFLQTLDSPENISVIYYTNGTFLLKEQDIVLLKKFKKVLINVSIDGVGELNDQIRKGSSWVDILNFLEQLKKTEFDISINSVIHLNSWIGLKDLADFVKSHNYNWITNILTYPKHLDITNLSSENKARLLEIIDSIDLPNKEYIQKHLYESIQV